MKFFDNEPAETKNEEAIVEFPDEQQRKKGYYYWEVGGQTYMLKLTTAHIERLENKFKGALMNVVIDGDIPPLSVMLDIVHAAMQPMNHKMSRDKVVEIYDRYVEDGGSQMELYSNVIMGICGVSGFFPQKLAQKNQQEIQEAFDML